MSSRHEYIGKVPARVIDQAAGNTAINKGTAGVGSTVTFDYTQGSEQIVTLQAGAVTLAFAGWSPAPAYNTMIVRANNAGLATITFPTINWVCPNGTYTTNIATYMGIIGRASMSSTMPTWMLVWTDDGSTLFGRLL